MQQFSALLVGEGDFSFSRAVATLLWPKGTKKSRCVTGGDCHTGTVDPLLRRRKGRVAPECPKSTDVTTATREECIGKKHPEEKISCNAAIAFFDLPQESTPLTSVAGRSIHLTCTSFDSRSEIHLKYPESCCILNQLEERYHPHLEVLHGVNGLELETKFAPKLFDAVVWNHPHLGVEDFSLHKFLMSHFFYSAKSILKPGGRIYVTLVDGQAERWSLKEQATRHGLQLSCRRPFIASMFPFYSSKRNRTAQSFQNVHTQQHTGSRLRSWTFVFVQIGEMNFICDQYMEGRTDEGPSIAEMKHVDCSFRCDECGAEFRTSQGLFTHTRQVHNLKKYGEWTPGSAKELRCIADGCDRCFHDEEARRQHVASRHQRDPGIPHPGRATTALALSSSADAFYPCGVCGQAVPNDWSQQQHLETLKPLAGLRATCGTCGRTFPETRAIRQHLNFCGGGGGGLGVANPPITCGTSLSNP